MPDRGGHLRGVRPTSAQNFPNPGPPLRSSAPTGSPLRPHSAGQGSKESNSPLKASRSHVMTVLRRRPWSAVIPKKSREQEHESLLPTESELEDILAKMGLSLWTAVPAKSRPKGDSQNVDKAAVLNLPSPINRHVDSWPDDTTCQAFFAARCKDTKCEGTNDQYEKFKTLISARLSLNSIKLSGAGVGAAFAGEVSKLLMEQDGAGIVELDLSCNSRLRDDGPIALSHFVASHACSLTRLDLSSINCGPKGAAAIFRALSTNLSIRTLLLGSKTADRNLMGPNPMAQLAGSLIVNSTLAVLALNANGIGPEGVKLLAPAMAINTSLHTLDLRSNSLRDASMPAVAASLELSGVTKIELANNKISTVGARDLAALLAKDILLQHLQLDDNAIGSKGATALGGSLHKNTRLTHLSLRDNKIGAQGCEALAGMFPHIPAPLFGGKASPSPAARVVPAAAATCALQALILSGNDIRDEGVVELCKRLQRNECLKVLDLSHNELTELAGEDLGSMIAHNVAMKSLVLQRNKLRSNGVIALSKGLATNCTLTCLNLRDNCMDDSCVSDLARAIQTMGSVIRMDTEVNYIDFEHADLLTRLVCQNKAAYEANACQRLGHELVLRWPVLTELPRVQARAEEEVERRKGVDASLEEVKGERVLEAEQSASALASLVEDTENARAELGRLETLEMEEQRVLTQLKKDTQENVDKQKRKADQAAGEHKRAAMKLEALRQDIQNEGTSMELLKALRLPANAEPDEAEAAEPTDAPAVAPKQGLELISDTSVAIEGIESCEQVVDLKERLAASEQRKDELRTALSALAQALADAQRATAPGEAPGSQSPTSPKPQKSPTSPPSSRPQSGKSRPASPKQRGGGKSATPAPQADENNFFRRPSQASSTASLDKKKKPADKAKAPRVQTRPRGGGSPTYK